MGNQKKEWLEKPVLERSNWYVGQIDKLLELIDPPNKLRREDIKLSQQLLNKIKERIELDYKFGDSKFSPPISIVEGQYYNKAIKASARLRVRINSRPSSDWFSQLYDAKDEIEDFLRFAINTKD